MYYDIEVVKKYLESFTEFGLNCYGGFSEDDVDNFVSSIDFNTVPDFEWEVGATKLVIIPIEEDYVIKIPFNGSWKYGDFFYFNGAESSFCDDYCEAELNIYEQAKQKGYERFFMPLVRVDCGVEYPVYVQQKVESYESEGEKNYFSKASKERIKNSKKARFLTLPLEWKCCCLDSFNSIEEFDEFITFLCTEEINMDLHRGNIGFLNKQAVILDYGGYCEQ